MNKKASSKTIEIELNTLEETQGNPQEMTPQEFEGLKKSIKEKGFILDDPVIWEYETGKYQIISGHHRIKAAQEVGYNKLNCKVITGITKQQGKLLVLEANQRRGRHNEILLNKFIDDMLDEYKDLDINTIFDSSGFETDINNIIETGADKVDTDKATLNITLSFKDNEEKLKFTELLDFLSFTKGKTFQNKFSNFIEVLHEAKTSGQLLQKRDLVQRNTQNGKVPSHAEIGSN